MKSQHSSKCPNCGREAGENYCPRCGQPTHLHDETFLSLVTHFFAHYFHYESKFWKTIGTLLTKPGELTIAYHKKQRARYVAPMSLYIFVVVVYFLASGMIGHVYEGQGWSCSDKEWELEQRQREARPKKDRPGVFVRFFGKTYGEKVEAAMADEAFESKITRYATRIFFFMIPVLALILSIFFFRKKEFQFVDHAVFAFHAHSFWFILILIPDILDFLPVYDILTNIVIVVLLLYVAKAMRNVYGISLLRSLVYAAIIWVLYLVMLLSVTLVTILLTY
jgi:hypothetical protein